MPGTVETQGSPSVDERKPDPDGPPDATAPERDRAPSLHQAQRQARIRVALVALTLIAVVGLIVIGAIRLLQT